MADHPRDREVIKVKAILNKWCCLHWTAASLYVCTDHLGNSFVSGVENSSENMLQIITQYLVDDFLCCSPAQHGEHCGSNQYPRSLRYPTFTPEKAWAGFELPDTT